ncbi:MAG: hypothetical protein KGV48_001725, partial [Alcaligenaceae bacterium]|nr:hypothetical protein [Alcaligenaceae bacterium]
MMLGFGVQAMADGSVTGTSSQLLVDGRRAKNPENQLATVAIGTKNIELLQDNGQPIKKAIGQIVIGAKTHTDENGQYHGATAVGADTVVIGTDSTGRAQSVVLGQADSLEAGVAIGNDDIDDVANKGGKPSWASRLTGVANNTGFSGFKFEGGNQKFGTHNGNKKGTAYNIEVYVDNEAAEKDRENWVKTVHGRKDGGAGDFYTWDDIVKLDADEGVTTRQDAVKKAAAIYAYNKHFNNSDAAAKYAKLAGGQLVNWANVEDKYAANVDRRYKRTKASKGSTALGVQSQALGAISAAFGTSSVSSGDFSTAMG